MLISPQKAQSPRVYIRRGSKKLGDIPANMLVTLIKKNKLQADDEFSQDGKKWIHLGSHHQLKSYFDVSHEQDTESESPTPLPNSQVNRQLSELADLLKEINT